MKIQNEGKKRSQYLGVGWCKRRNAWRARITVSNATLELGFFQAELDAAKAFNAAAEKFACRSRNILPEEDLQNSLAK
jgi:hypothetical protein